MKHHLCRTSRCACCGFRIRSITRLRFEAKIDGFRGPAAPRGLRCTLVEALAEAGEAPRNRDTNRRERRTWSGPVAQKSKKGAP